MLNTRDNRSSALFVTLPFRTLPNPDTIVSRSNRQQISFSYAGILASIPDNIFFQAPEERTLIILNENRILILD